MFPAYAGVILKALIMMLQIMSVPRVCGGDPEDKKDDDKDVGCSPRMRG